MTGFCIFGEDMFCLYIVHKTKYIFLALGIWECSSELEHSTADREVGGSIPLAPFFNIWGYLSKTLDVWKINQVHYVELPRRMNNAFSSNFIVVHDRLLYFWRRYCFIRDCSQNLVCLPCVGMWECSSEVKHSTADREVRGSIPLTAFFIIWGYLSKDFWLLKDWFNSSFWTTKEHESCFFVVFHCNFLLAFVFLGNKWFA